MNVSPLYLVTYDVESWPNFFSVDFEPHDTREHHFFEISDWRDDSEELIQYCRNLWLKNAFLVGFRSILYDYIVFDAILRRKVKTPCEIFKLSKSVIDCPDHEFYDRFSIWEKDRLLKQIDLYKIHHFDNGNRMTSLKSIQFNMQMETIVDLPVEPEIVLNEFQAQSIREYNPHDTTSTTDFAIHSIESINFRSDLKQKYPKKDWLNYADTKIGKEYFVMMLERAGIKCYEYIKGVKHKRQTHRKEIVLKDAILDKIEFDTPAFNTIKCWLQDRVLVETKGVLSKDTWHKIDITDLENGVYELINDEFKLGKKKITKKQLKVFPELPYESMKYDSLCDVCNEFRVLDGYIYIKGIHAYVNGFRFDFGTGGIHGSIHRETVESCNQYQIMDIDVESKYPKVGITNGFYPEHLGPEFCKVYEMLFNERKKHPKGTAPNKMIKLGLNGVYGESNSKYSIFYDPLYTMKVTLNGQLFICKLAEMIWEKLPNAELIQVNTDGLTLKVKQTERYTLGKIVEEWETFTKLRMETALYDKMCIRDVNNYIAVHGDSIKRKGAYEYLAVHKGGTLDWNKNHSALVVPKVVEQVLVYGKDPYETLRYWPDIFDFMIKAKVEKKGKFILKKGENEYTEIQKTSRVYASKDGYEMFKLLPPLQDKVPKDGFFKFDNKEWRKSSFLKDRKVTDANNVRGMAKQNMNIDYDFYLDEVYKLLKGLTTTFNEGNDDGISK